MASDVFHANGVTVHTSVASDGMPRPASIGVTGTASDPLPGLQYAYDGSGNVKSINSDSYKYDRVSRLVAASHGPNWLQNVTFDTYGNIQSFFTHHDPPLLETPTSATTNRLTGSLIEYDASGNLTSWNLQSYEYDLLNRTTRVDTGTEEWVFAYTADDERIWAVRADGGRSVWTLRGLDGKVLRRAEFFAGNGACGAAQRGSAGFGGAEAGLSIIFEEDFESGDLCAWSLVIPDQAHWEVNDYVWRGASLLAVNTPGGDTHHFHLDHLGTPRLITGTLFDGPAEVVAYHAYQPFGEEVTPTTQDSRGDEVHRARAGPALLADPNGGRFGLHACEDSPARRRGDS